eukprot:5318463-Pyramimonas_sp.AAC.2
MPRSEAGRRAWPRKTHCGLPTRQRCVSLHHVPLNSIGWHNDGNHYRRWGSPSLPWAEMLRLVCNRVRVGAKTIRHDFPTPPPSRLLTRGSLSGLLGHNRVSVKIQLGDHRIAF